MNLISSLIEPIQQIDLWQKLKSEKLLDQVYSRVIKKGSLNIIDAGGKTHRFGDFGSPSVTIRLTDSSLYHKLALNPELYIGEAYMDGKLTIEEGTLKDFFEILFCNTGSNMPQGWLRFLETGNYLIRRLRQLNTIPNSTQNVKHHYDLSVEFYSLFLDKDKQYSCAYFTEAEQTLEEAQKMKIEHIVKKLLIESDDEVLDIGCGWGGLACEIAKQKGARVKGITLSGEQLKVAKMRARKEGVSELVKFELADYRQLHADEGTYDRIVSVGMFEHVGIQQYPAFFQKVNNLLKEDGVMLLHSIGRAQGPASTNAWIRKYIFPGGYIPALSEVIPHVEKNNLHITDIEVLRMHYARTLQEWRYRFYENLEEVRKIYDSRFCRMWEFYLTGAEASFEHWGNMVFHLQITKKLDAVPLTRDYLYKREAGF